MTFIKGQPSWNKGKPWSEEVKALISDSKKGCKAWNKGKKWSKEVKQKISRTQKANRAKLNK